MNEAQLNLPYIKPNNMFLALFPIVLLMIMLASSVMVFGGDGASGANQVALIIAGIVTICIGMYRGFSYKYLEDEFVKGISSAISSLIILLLIGGLVASWSISGTIPTMISYGVHMLNTDYLYLCALVVSSFVSLSIGSSWSTCATIGVAFIGISNVLGLNPAITAGAIISGAYFGDKLSPLSETTNLASTISGVELSQHVKNMLYTTIPSIVLAGIIFTIIGLTLSDTANSVNPESITAIDTELNKVFNISVINLIPLVFLIVMSVMRLPTILILVTGIVTGVIIAITYQTNTVAILSGKENDLVNNLLYVWAAIAEGVNANFGNDTINELLSGGGMVSMTNTLFLVIAAVFFGSLLDAVGSLKYLLNKISFLVRRLSLLMVTTVCTAISLNLITGDQYISIILPGKIYKNNYIELNVSKTLMSRSLEDGGTITSVLIPWHSCAVFISGVLGISTLDYLPYCLFNIINPILAIIVALFFIKYFNISLNKFEKEAEEEAGIVKCK